MTSDRFLPHKVLRENRPDGSILLTSGYPLGPHANVTGDWLHRWAVDAPDRIFLAERSGADWRSVTYREALETVRAIGAALIGRGYGPETPILVISGNGVDHGLLALAAQYVDVPIVPVAEQYALLEAAHGRLQHAVGLVRPRMVYAVDGAQYAQALALPEIAALDLVVSRNPGPGMSLFDDLLRGDASADLDARHASIGPDSIAKILLTSGSTAHPKGVLTTHKMLCTNQAQIAGGLPFLQQKPPRIVDWLPWNHVFGGSHNFNMMLANGGSLYIDNGKPVPALIGQTIENLRMVPGTCWFNVPVGFAMVVEAMKDDRALRESVFAELDMVFYAGASLPQDVWDALEAMARDVRGELPLITSSWGLTETAPGTLLQHEPTDRSGIVGVPLPGVVAKLVPDEDARFEVRIKGPNVTPGYLGDPAKTAEAFDEEGFFRTGDAMKFVDPEDISRVLQFDGRISEDFKLLSGTWVRAANLRLAALGMLAGLASDVVVTGADRAEIGLLIFPLPGPARPETKGAVTDAALLAQIHDRLARQTGGGSASRICRALVMAAPPSVGEGEITAKGNLNFPMVLSRRKTLLERLYDDTDPAVVRV